ncbi:MAG: hypothetical protein U0871_06970 [Gemmataceae bacterium]
MTRFRSGAGLVLALVAGLVLAGPVAAGDPVPFKGGFAGTDLGRPIPNTPFASVIVEAEGNSTQLGRFAYTAQITVNTATGVGSGTFVFTAANGDTVYGTVSGRAAFTPPNVLSIAETATITGGTGRFAGATGGFDVARLKDTVTGETAASFEGAISFPGR